MVTISLWIGDSITNREFWRTVAEFSIAVFLLVYYELFIITFVFIIGFFLTIKSEKGNGSSSGKGGSFGGGGSSGNWD